MVMDLFYKAAGTVLAPFRYAQREIEKTKENLKEDARHAVYSALKIFAAALCLLFFLLFISFAAAIAVNISMNSAWSGFAIVSAAYLLLGVLMYAWKKLSDKKNQAS